MHCNACAVRIKGAAGAGPFRGRRGVTGAHAGGGLRAVYVWQNIFSSS